MGVLAIINEIENKNEAKKLIDGDEIIQYAKIRSSETQVILSSLFELRMINTRVYDDPN